MDNDTSLIWESFIQEKKKDTELKVRKGNIGQDKPDCIATGERIERPKKGKGSYNRKEKHSKGLEEAAEDLVGVDTQTVGDSVPQDLLHVLSMFDGGVMRADDFFQFPEAEQIIGWGWVDQQPTPDQFGNSWVSLTDKGNESARSGTIS